jgi:glycosyltransferase involved in cell wall biosynthesis
MVSAKSFPFIGGVETHIHEVSRRLVAQGHDVTVLSTDPTGSLPVEEHTEGVKTLRVPSYPRGRDYYVAPAVYRIVREGAWDIVHCQGYNTAVPPLAMLGSIRSRTPYVLTFHSGGHSSRLRSAVRPIQQAALRPLLAHAARLICVSRFEADFFARRLRLPSQRFVVIPNGSSMTGTRPESGVDSSLTPRILSVGRLERYKGHHRIIEAMPFILRAIPSASLRILGAGPEETPLRALVEDLGISPAVSIERIDPKERQGMAEALSQASLVTLLSEYEAHPISVMEALALRRPVLVTHTSGLAELADHGMVRSIPLSSSPSDVADAVLHNLRDPLLPPEAALPSWDDCAHQVVATYEQVILDRSCAS